MTVPDNDGAGFHLECPLFIRSDPAVGLLGNTPSEHLSTLLYSASYSMHLRRSLRLFGVVGCRYHNGRSRRHADRTLPLWPEDGTWKGDCEPAQVQNQSYRTEHEAWPSGALLVGQRPPPVVGETIQTRPGHLGPSRWTDRRGRPLDRGRDGLHR